VHLQLGYVNLGTGEILRVQAPTGLEVAGQNEPLVKVQIVQLSHALRIFLRPAA
jgi:hypothetical protein